MTIDVSKLSGEDLFTYYTQDCEDTEYRSIVSLLPYAVENASDAYALLERLEREHKRLVVFYPAFQDVPKDIEIVGNVPDGVLCIQ